MSTLYDIYEKARRMGESCLRERQSRHESGMLPVLDELLEGISYQTGKTSRPMEILTDRIVGTCHAARTESFAYNFMPLLASDSEFAQKWMNLYHSASSEGLQQPILVYEVYGRYFVEEGNKRVSVTKFMKNPQILAEIRPVVLDLPDGAEKELYEAYLNFCALTGIDCILMTRKKNYKSLLRLLGVSTEHPLDKEKAAQLLSLFYNFETVFEKTKGSRGLRANSGDAFLIYLEVYGIDFDKAVAQSTLEKEIEHIWQDITAYPDKNDAVVIPASSGSTRKKLLNIFREPLRVYFIESHEASQSAWTKEHQRGIEYAKEQLKGQAELFVIDNANTPKQIEEALSDAVSHQAGVIFTTNPTMLQLTNQFAARYPKIHFLNCALNPDTGPARTYFVREYEVEFLIGLAAGILSESLHIGYIADYPIYGTIAGINAFSIGVQMVRPQAKIYLDWSTTQNATLSDFPVDIDMLYLAGSDFDPRILQGKKFGLFDVRAGKFLHLADIQVHWGVFYTRILRSVLNDTYDLDAQNNGFRPINYWLGLANEMLEVSFSDALPSQSQRLIRVFEQAMAAKSFFTFRGEMTSNTGKVTTQSDSLSYENLLTMNWLNSNIVGSIPREEQLTSTAEEIVRVHGIEDQDEEQDEDSGTLQEEKRDESSNKENSTRPSAV